MGAIHALRVESPYKLISISDIKIENKPNEHGYLYLKCLIDDSINFESTIKASTDDKISIYEELEDEDNENKGDKSPVNINEVNKRNSKRLFYGIVQNIRTTNTDGVYYLEIEALTSSFELDIEEKSRSFQNANMTYDELIQIIVKDYPDYMYTQIIGKGQKIGKPLFQFRETDWCFLKRIASELKSELYCDVIEIYNLFYFGRPSLEVHEIEDMKRYKACKKLQVFRNAGGYDAGYNDTDYFYYEIERKELFNVGDNISFRDKKFYVNQYSAYAIKDEVIYKYRLCRKNGVWQTKLYNSKLQGVSLEGKVIDRDGEKVKLHLNIDKEQNKDEATWFTFAPPTGEIMYCMPIIGTSARLYFPNESSEEPIVTGCVRNNGSSCQKTSDTTKRYLGTEHGSEIEMTPNALNVRGKEPVSISFDDNVGVTITSHKKLTINANDDIIMKTPKNVTINATSQLFMKKAGTKSGFSMENEIHFLSNNVIRNGRDREAFAPIDNTPPKPVKQEPPKEEKKGFNWGKLACNVLAGLAVAAVAAAVVAAVVFTAGTAVPALAGAIAAAGTSAGEIAGGVFGAGMFMGALSVGGKAASDIKSGEVSDTSEYMMLGGKAGFAGALTQAIFAPFTVFKALGSTAGLIGEIPTTWQRVQGLVEAGVIGGTYNVTYDYVRNALDGKIPNAQEVLESYKDGALFGAYFHVGGEAISEASPFIKNAFSKASSELSDNMKALKYAWDNVEVPKDVKLGSNGGNIDLRAGKDFVKKYNEYKNGIDDVNKDDINVSDVSDISRNFDLDKAEAYERKIDNSKYFYHDQGDFGEEVSEIVAKDNNLGDDVSSMFQSGRNGIDRAFISEGPPPKLTMIESKASKKGNFSYSDEQKLGGEKYFENMINDGDGRYDDFEENLEELKRRYPGLQVDYIRVETKIKINDIGFGVDDLKVKDWNAEID